MARYSLADYILVVAIPASMSSALGIDTIAIGGQGSYVGSIKTSMNKEVWTTEGDNTGSWVHNKNLDRTGTCEVSVNMLADVVTKLKRVCGIYYTSSGIKDGLTMTISNNDGKIIATMNDCFVSKIPDQVMEATAGQQSWSFTCGQIIYS